MDLKDLLIQEDIVKIKPEDTPEDKLFLLKSGKRSRLFIDIKEASLNPHILREIRNLVIELYYELIYERERKYDKIVSIAVGSIPIASVLSLKTMIPQIIIRSEKHERGTQVKILGDKGNDNLRGKTCLLIEDVATTGGSIINAISELNKVGAICEDIIVIVDREEGARELCEKNNLNLYSILKKSDFGINIEE